MSVASKIAWDDTILPFQLDRSDIRGRIVRLDKTLDQILTQHRYPTVVQGLVAEAALLTAMIGQAIKLQWKLSLQIRGDGPLRIIATDYYAPSAPGEPAQMRAYASFDAETIPEQSDDAFGLIGKGMFAVLIDQGEGTTPYQGITPLAGGSLSNCASTYFAQSEQLPTRFAVGSALAIAPGETPVWRAGGVMLQHMPKASPGVASQQGTGDGGLLSHDDILGGDEGENWNRVNTLLDTVELTELVGPHITADSLLFRLFHEETPRIFTPQPVKFGCTCSEEKVVQTMSIYSQKDIAHMTTDAGTVTADCQFCGAHYEMDPTTLGFEGKRKV